MSEWYIDARMTTFDGRGARIVGEAILAHLAADVTAIGGMTMGADPVAVATAIAGSDSGRPLKAFSIRKATKDHGTGGRLVGPVGSGDVVAIVEDTTSTGGAFFEAIEAAVEAGLVVSQALVLVDRSQGRVERLMADAGIPYLAMVTAEELGLA